MKIGLVGLSQSGKTTLFHALTGTSQSGSGFSGDKPDQNIAVVKVGDERVGLLQQMYKPKSTVYATFDLVDFAGMAASGSKEDADDSVLMRMMRTMDAFAVVVRGFTNEYVTDAPHPQADIETMVQEFYLNDQVICEKRLEKIEAGYKRGQKTPALQAEEKVLRRVLEKLDAVESLSGLEFGPDEQRILRGFQFLTLKPLLIVLNVDESRFGKQPELVAQLAAAYPVLEISGRFEMELAGLGAEDAALFMADAGITESVRNRLTTALYQILGYISFFTVGEDEVRAWTIRDGANAVEAAGAIHSDLARGFIRAECFAYQDLVDLGSEKAIRDKGKLRLEGKEYRVRDGDCLSIRFNV